MQSASNSVYFDPALVAQFAEALSHPEQLRAGGFEQPEGPFDIVINATSASLAGDLPPVPFLSTPTTPVTPRPRCTA